MKEEMTNTELEEIQKNIKGGKIRVFCRDCRKEYFGKSGCKCSINRKLYIAAFYLLNDKMKKKNLKSRTPALAIVEFEKLKEEIHTNTEFNVNQLYLKQAIKNYVNFKKSKNLSKGHIGEMERYLDYLSIEVKNPEYFKLSDFNKSNSITFLNNIQEKYNLSSKTINKIKVHYSSMFIYFIEKLEINIQNPFKLIKNKIDFEEKRENTISKDKFFEFIYWLNNKPKVDITIKHITQNDLIWLPFAFLLQYYTRVKREDVVQIKWSDINKLENQYIIKLTNFTKSRLQGKLSQNIEKENLPISVDFIEFLKELGFDKKQNTNEYILFSPEQQIQIGIKKIVSRDVMIRKISTGFSYLAKQKFGQSFELPNKQIREIF